MKTHSNGAIFRNDATDPNTLQVDLNAAILKPVTVRVASLPTPGQGALASIFDINGSPISNPTATDDNGNYSFQAASGIYDVIIDEGVLDIIEPSIDLTGGINDLSQTYDFPTVAEYKSFTSEFPVGKRIYLADRDAYFNVIAGTGTDNTFNVIASTSVSQSVSLVLSDSMTLKSFGGVSSSGEDLSKSANNSLALEAAVSAASSGINSVEKGGTITLGFGEWTFDAVDVQGRWGWKLDAQNSKIFFNGVWNCSGCAFFDLDMGWCEPTTAKLFTITGFYFFRSTVGSERTHNMSMRWKLISGFQRGIHFGESFSQADIGGGSSQFGGCLKTIEGESGGENVIIKDIIFATNTNATTPSIELTGGNAQLRNLQFETLPGVDRAEILLHNSAGASVQGCNFVTSGGVNVTGAGFCNISGNMFNNCIGAEIIENTSVGTSCDGNTFRWSFNNGAGTIYTDGTGKTAIKTTQAMDSCANNRVRRADIGVHTTSSALQSFSNNKMQDTKTQAYLLQGASNVKIQGGAISLDQLGERGIVVTGTNGNGNKFSGIAWEGDESFRYQISTGNGQNSIIIDDGDDDPDTLGIPVGGSGSMFSVIGFGAGTSLFVAGFDANTGFTVWVPQGTMQRTQAQMLSSSDFINTVGKYRTRSVLNTNNSVEYFAVGATPTSQWKSKEDGTFITPT